MNKFICFISILCLAQLVSCSVETSSSLSSSNNSSTISISSSSSEKEEDLYKNAIFFDSNSDDNGDGTLDKPYNSLEPISTLELKPGSTIYLCSDSKFSGSLKLSNVHGTESNPITISSFGKGKMPSIDGNNLEGSGIVHLENCSNITIENLELFDSCAIEGDRRGILITLDNPENVEEVKTYKNIKIKNVYIHDINGFRDAANSGMAISSKKTGGIHLWSNDGYGRVENLEISNCRISNVSNVGIATWYNVIDDTVKKISPYNEDFPKFAHLNVHIHHNEINYIGKNAIFARNLLEGLIEYNVIHDTAIHCVSGNTIVTSFVYGTIIQFNEGYRNLAKPRESDGKIQDGCMLDADLSSRDTIWQYNYSHDNSFGLFINCTSYDQEKGYLDKVIVRYNISINDLGKKGIVYINYASDGIYVYNNTIITSKESEFIIQSNNKRKSFFYNNLIYNRSANAKFFIPEESGMIAEYNLIFNESDAAIDDFETFKKLNVLGVYEDPIFQGHLQEESNIGIDDLHSYKVENNSPALGVGKYIENVDYDFFGNNYKESIGFYCG